MMTEQGPDIISTPNDTSFGGILSKPTDELLFNVPRITETPSLVGLCNFNFSPLGGMLDLMDWILG